MVGLWLVIRKSFWRLSAYNGNKLNTIHRKNVVFLNVVLVRDVTGTQITKRIGRIHQLRELDFNWNGKTFDLISRLILITIGHWIRPSLFPGLFRPYVCHRWVSIPINMPTWTSDIDSPTAAAGFAESDAFVGRKRENWTFIPIRSQFLFLQQFRKRYKEWDDPHNETGTYHNGTHYSSAMIVCSYLVRLGPFTQQLRGQQRRTRRTRQQ